MKSQYYNPEMLKSKAYLDYENANRERIIRKGEGNRKYFYAPAMITAGGNYPVQTQIPTKYNYSMAIEGLTKERIPRRQLNYAPPKQKKASNTEVRFFKNGRRWGLCLFSKS